MFTYFPVCSVDTLVKGEIVGDWDEGTERIEPINGASNYDYESLDSCDRVFFY